MIYSVHLHNYVHVHTYSSPPTHSAFASHSVPATRHLFLRPLVTPPPSPTSITASTHTPRTTGEGCEGQEGEDEEDKGGDLYVSPRVFQEDQEQDQERRELVSCQCTTIPFVDLHRH